MARLTCQSRRVRALWAALVGSALAAATGCTPDFEDAWVVRDLRILAIKATPPEVLFDAVPDRLPPVRVDALVVHPEDPDPEVTWELWVCSADKTRCDEARVRYLARAGRSRASGLSFSVVLSGAVFGEMVDADTESAYAGAEVPLRYRNGVPVMVELKVRRGEERDRAVKRLVYGQRYPAHKLQNRNPTLTDVTRTQGGVLLRGSVLNDTRPVVLEPRPAEGDAEEFIIPTLSFGDLTAGGGPQIPEERIVSLREYLSYSFYIVTGTISHPTTGGPPALFVRDKKVDDVTSTYTPLPLPTPVPVWVVARDGRGGVDFTTLTFRFR